MIYLTVCACICRKIRTSRECVCVCEQIRVLNLRSSQSRTSRSRQQTHSTILLRSSTTPPRSQWANHGQIIRVDTELLPEGHHSILINDSEGEFELHLIFRFMTSSCLRKFHVKQVYIFLIIKLQPLLRRKVIRSLIIVMRSAVPSRTTKQLCPHHEGAGPLHILVTCNHTMLS